MPDIAYIFKSKCAHTGKSARVHVGTLKQHEILTEKLVRGV